jgi:hypothetical protein
MNHVLVAQVAYDNPVGQQAWLVHDERWCDDPWALNVPFGHGFFGSR